MEIIESSLKWNNPLTYSNVPVMIVLHHAEASQCTVYDVHAWHLGNGWAGIGYHYFVRKDGRIYTGRPENAIGSHCLGANDKSIGICAEGTYMTEDMPEVQKQAIISLCKGLVSRRGIKQIYGHKELYNTSCPGDKYPLSEIKELTFKVESEEDNMQLPDNWNDEKYLNANPDVKAAVDSGAFKDGADHWLQYGYREPHRYLAMIIPSVVETINKGV